MPEYVKIVFPLEVDDDGFPPIGAETLNARVSETEGFVIENTPFFVTDVALGDRVDGQAIPGAGHKYSFTRVLESSSAKALSIIFLEQSIKENTYQELKGKGCYCEYGRFGELEMLAVSVPESCDYSRVFEYLSECEERDLLSFAELAV
jgi:hypothetical protein